jgi:hypothetical protein
MEIGMEVKEELMGEIKDLFIGSYTTDEIDIIVDELSKERLADQKAKIQRTIRLLISEVANEYDKGIIKDADELIIKLQKLIDKEFEVKL